MCAEQARSGPGGQGGGAAAANARWVAQGRARARARRRQATPAARNGHGRRASHWLGGGWRQSAVCGGCKRSLADGEGGLPCTEGARAPQLDAAGSSGPPVGPGRFRPPRPRRPGGRPPAGGALGGQRRYPKAASGRPAHPRGSRLDGSGVREPLLTRHPAGVSSSSSAQPSAEAARGGCQRERVGQPCSEHQAGRPQEDPPGGGQARARGPARGR